MSARLTFADGARIDVLVTVSDDAITVEDLRADPPLALDGFTALAHWMEGPLDDACRLATGRPRRPRPVPAPPATPWGETLAQAEAASLPESERTPDHAPDPTAAPEPQREPAPECEAPGEAAPPGGTEAPAEAVTYGTGEQRSVPTAEPADAAPDADERVDPSSATGTAAPSGTAAAPEATETVEDAPESVAAQSAIRVRGKERCKVAADAYQQAQREGRDPVAAVMDATRRGRRRSLKLIAAARDAGFLAPRHNKR
ncbi:DUF6214 family protein [Streptomyces sp. NPDC050161]|uniref:DUF6214 family protein n=1 Tax=Streptomyces sp. NPDC050161 TaxID=3365604 RepID=UPI00378CC275